MYFERALFICAPPGCGKSTQLRSVTRDMRLGYQGKVFSPEEKRKLLDIYPLSNERWLYLKLSSPHESKQSPTEFHNLIHSKLKKVRRGNFMGAMQPDSRNKMPDIVQCCSNFVQEFNPERLRVVFLSPTHNKMDLASYSQGRDFVAELHSLGKKIEVLAVDGRSRNLNGLIYADFFDFT